MNSPYNTNEAFETVPNSIDAKLAPAVHALTVLNASTREPFLMEVCMESKTCTKCGDRPRENGRSQCKECRNEVRRRLA